MHFVGQGRFPLGGAVLTGEPVALPGIDKEA